MFYVIKGKIYSANPDVNGKYAQVAVTLIDGGYSTSRIGQSLAEIPGGCMQITLHELIARYPQLLITPAEPTFSVEEE